MHRALVAVGCVVVTAPRGEVNRTAYLLVKEYVADCLGDVRIDADCKFADVSRAFVSVENGVRFLAVVGGCFDNLAVLKFEAHVLETESVFNRRGVVTYHAVDAVLDGRGVNFAVGNVASAVAFDCGYAFYRERQIGVFCHNPHFIRTIHQINQRIHSVAHFLIVKTAYVEEVVLKRFRAHRSELAHTRRGVSQNDPTRVRDASVAVHGDAVSLVVFLHYVFGHVGKFVTVVAAAYADVAVHLVHKIGVALRPHIQHLSRRAFENFLFESLVDYVEEGDSAVFVHFANDTRGQLLAAADCVNPNFVSLADVYGIVDEVVCQNFLPFVDNHNSPANV